MGIAVVVPAVQAEVNAPLAQATGRIIRSHHLQRVQQGPAPMNIATIRVVVRRGDPDLSDGLAFGSLGPTAPPAPASNLAEGLGSVG
jgi:hypothetical protein